MQKYIVLDIKKLPEGHYLATSDEIQGLVAQGKTFEETIDIAKDVAQKLVSSQKKFQRKDTISDTIIYPMLITV